MLKPVIVRANFKIAVSQTVTLETLLGVNLPLMFPDVLVMNRTPTACSMNVAGIRRLTYTGQSDPDFDGVVTYPAFTTFALSEGNLQKLSGLDQSGLLPSSYGQVHEITFTNSGPAAEVRVSLVIKGFIESSVSPDPLVIVNV